MDAFGGPSQSRERSRSNAASYPRAPSRSSASTSVTRMTPQSSNSSSTNLPPSPSLRHAQLGHRLHPLKTEQPRSQLSKTPAEDPSRQDPPAVMSTFLQEKLQQGRRMESERSSSRASNHASPRAGQGSPVRAQAPDSGTRPRSRGGPSIESPTKKGLGLKEMEQTMSNLHKQNFDLKLELYHRRERQTELEDRAEALEAEKMQAEQMNHSLLQEIEKRDKAVEEAVAMIVTLEARIEQLLKEREMVRRVENTSFLFSRSDSFGSQDAGTPRSRPARAPSQDRTLARVPSFVSEQSEDTENLRNVYLGVRGSVLSLSKTPDEARVADSNGVASPSLSVLSESSFISIYGQKDRPACSPPKQQPAALDGSPAQRPAAKYRFGRSVSGSQIVTPTRMRRGASLGQSHTVGAFSSINDVVRLRTSSPLQRTEPALALPAASDTSPAAQEQEPRASASARPQRPGQQRARDEKREALRKMLTDAPARRGLHQSQSQNLPPTPDTISTATLAHYQKSNDTLSRQPEAANERSYLALSDHSASEERGEPDAGGGRVAQPLATSASTGRRDLSGASYQERLGAPPRPRSADETASARRRRRRSGNDWDTDSEAEFDDDAGSAASSFDYWLREGLMPSRADGHSPAGDGAGAGRPSPDLFGFPSGDRGWAADEMFGPRGGGGSFVGAHQPGLAPPLHVTAGPGPSPHSSSFFGGGPPPPPNRRSSLHAQTGSAPGTPSVAARQSPAHSRLRASPDRRRGSSISQAVPDACPDPPSQTPPGQDQHAGKRHYPPNASQATQPRTSRLRLFRRSMGSAPGSPMPAPARSTEPSLLGFGKGAGAPMVGVPSWGRRADLVDDERASATPPPILRSRAPTQGGGSVSGEEAAAVAAAAAAAVAAAHDKAAPPSASPPRPSPPRRGLGSGLDKVAGPSDGRDGGAPLAPPSSNGSQPPASAAGPAKKKWLALGRMASLRRGTQ